jgi:hypothetical protein
MKRLFEVKVSLTFVAQGEDEAEVADLMQIAINDASYSDFDVRTRPLVQILKGSAQTSGDKPTIRFSIPSGWDRQSLVYGTDDDSTLGEILDAEVKALEEQATAKDSKS